MVLLTVVSPNGSFVDTVVGREVAEEVQGAFGTAEMLEFEGRVHHVDNNVVKHKYKSAELAGVTIREINSL